VRTDFQLQHEAVIDADQTSGTPNSMRTRFATLTLRLSLGAWTPVRFARR
jgi:hypothetical protein